MSLFTSSQYPVPFYPMPFSTKTAGLASAHGNTLIHKTPSLPNKLDSFQKSTSQKNTLLPLQFGSILPDAPPFRDPDAKPVEGILIEKPRLTLKQIEAKYDAEVARFAQINPPYGNWLNNFFAQYRYRQQKKNHQQKLAAINNEKVNVIYEGAEKYLPSVTREQLFGRKGYMQPWNMQRLKDWWASRTEAGQGLYYRTIISLAGPVVVKYAQTQAQDLINLDEGSITKIRRAYKDAEEQLQKNLANLEPADEKYRHVTSDKEREKKIEAYQKQIEKRREKLAEIQKNLTNLERIQPFRTLLKGMLDNVPPVAYKLVEKDIIQLKATYNKEHPDNPITQVDPTSLAAGSMAQVHVARTKNGNKLILKVFRPEASGKYFEAYKKFAQFLLFFIEGNDAEDQVVKEAEGLMKVFTEEIDPNREKMFAAALQDRVKKLGYDIYVPQVLTVTGRGFVQEFAAGENLTNIPKVEDKAKALQVLGPAMYL